MEHDNISMTPSSPARRGRRLRIIAAVILLLGIFGADLVYWLGTRAPATSPDPSLLGNEKEQARKEEMIFGKQTALFEEWRQDLARPGTQAVIIVLTGGLAAGVCLHFARLLDASDERARPENPRSN